ncbi:MAG: pseudouridine-5'-phosphate glycosidase [Thermoanaerobaculia bacterium]
MSEWFTLSVGVEDALGSSRPVVALESTVVTHGLPHPQGVETAAELEAVVREHGAVPATIAVLDGRAKVGVSMDELERLAGSGAVKLNLANLAPALAAGTAGSTTVAATMALAHRAGIRVFATGGIGGVHRGAADTGDVSSDLTALARIPVAVVCAGAKAILDLPGTIERLETLGVPVLGYGTDEFPAFYRRSSTLPVDARFDTASALARAIGVHWEIGDSIGGCTGVIVANPIPAEAEMPRELYQQALEAAEAAVGRRDTRGRDVTPVLLSELAEATGGHSVASNRALLANNARLAAELARAFI